MNANRIITAATRSAVPPLAGYLYMVFTGHMPVEFPPSRRTMIGLAILSTAWIMETVWQIRSRVERWGWISVGVGYLVCLFIVTVVIVIAVRVLPRL
jgi:hypothetical protein